jgi:hypothetical protein
MQARCGVDSAVSDPEQGDIVTSYAFIITFRFPSFVYLRVLNKWGV